MLRSICLLNVKNSNFYSISIKALPGAILDFVTFKQKNQFSHLFFVRPKNGPIDTFSFRISIISLLPSNFILIALFFSIKLLVYMNFVGTASLVLLKMRKKQNYFIPSCCCKSTIFYALTTTSLVPFSSFLQFRMNLGV